MRGGHEGIERCPDLRGETQARVSLDCHRENADLRPQQILREDCGLAPRAEQSAERCVRFLSVGMIQVVGAKCDDFAIAANGLPLVLVTVVMQKALHQPRFSVVWVDIENSIEKDLGYFPAFFGDCACSVASIDGDYSLIARWIDVDLWLEKSKRFHIDLNN